jgi:Flp pilus assembly protein TadB
VDYLLTALASLAGATLTFAVYQLFVARRRRLHQRLQDAAPAGSEPTEQLLLGDWTPALAAGLPGGAATQTDLQKELRGAGYYRPAALTEYLALRALLTLLPVTAAAAAGLFVSTGRSALWVWAAGLTAGGLGYSLPRIYLHSRMRARRFAVERGLPTALDLLTLCLGAGLNVLVSLHRVAAALREAYPVLAYELELVSRQAELRTLSFALTQFADRIGLPQVRNIAVLLTQSENLGTDAAAVLREYSDTLRVDRKHRAEELANKAPFKLLFPAYLLAAGAGILLISPTALEFAEFRQSNLVGDSIEQAREVLQNQETSKPATPAPSEEEP